MAMIRKREQYLEVHLNDFLQQREAVPFAWGTNDCATFAADAIEVMTGIDIAQEFRGQYSTETGALRTIQKIAGGNTLGDAATYCANKYGMAERSVPLQAKRGDLVLVKNGDGDEIAAIVGMNGRHVLSPGEDGLVRFSILNVTRAWALGEKHEWTPPRWHKHRRVERDDAAGVGAPKRVLLLPASVDAK
jgi:cell wall-associated NlpC family hydrolase